MTLSDWLTVFVVGAFLWAVGRHSWEAYQKRRGPEKGPQGGESVKPKRRSLAFKARSQRSQGSNAVNASSQHQDASSQGSPVHSVQPAAAAPAPPAGDAGQGDDGFTLSARELAQLGEALQLYREGATIEQAVCKAFGVTKGGTEGWKRAKALFDAATVAPGAAPAGTYTATAPLRRSRRRVATR